jgi:hypothetical protein
MHVPDFPGVEGVDQMCLISRSRRTRPCSMESRRGSRDFKALRTAPGSVPDFSSILITPLRIILLILHQKTLFRVSGGEILRRYNMKEGIITDHS